MSDARTYKVTYFGHIHGRASAIKFQLRHAGQNFEEENIDFKDWTEKKREMGGVSLPVITINDSIVMCEAVPISRCIGIKYG